MNEEYDLLNETLDKLVQMINKGDSSFFREYKNLPFELYSEIERLSVSKSSLFKDRCEKASFIAETFHRSIK